MSKSNTSGNLIVVSAPSGAGKTSLVRAVIERLDGIVVSVSHTTRAQRPGELDGKDYFFVDESRFEAMAARGDFLEHAQVFGNYYGTSHSAIQRQLDEGTDLILEIDWQGARIVKSSYPQSISLFILPPSQRALRERLVGRGVDDAEVIEKRMQAALGELSHYHEYDYLVVNDDFTLALEEFSCVVQAARLQTERRSPRLADLLNKLMA